MDKKFGDFVSVLESFGFCAKGIFAPNITSDAGYSAALYEYGREQDLGFDPLGFVWAVRQGGVLWLGIEPSKQHDSRQERLHAIERVAFAATAVGLYVLQNAKDPLNSMLCVASSKDKFLSVREWLGGYTLAEGSDGKIEVSLK